MPHHQQLGVLGSRAPAEQDQPAAEPDEDEVEQAQGHGRSSCPTAAWPIAAAHRLGRLLAPHSHRGPGAREREDDERGHQRTPLYLEPAKVGHSASTDSKPVPTLGKLLAEYNADIPPATARTGSCGSASSCTSAKSTTTPPTRDAAAPSGQERAWTTLPVNNCGCLQESFAQLSATEFRWSGEVEPSTFGFQASAQRSGCSIDHDLGSVRFRKVSASSTRPAAW